MPIKAVLFDMFDTLMIIEKDHAFYSPAVKRMHNFIQNRGIEVTFPEFRDAYIQARDNLYEKADLKMEEPHFNVRVSNALQNLGYNYGSDSDLVSGATAAFCQEFMKYVRLDKYAPKVLKELYGKYKIGLVSNFAIPECVLSLLERNDLKKFFAVIIVSGAVNRRKPNPDIYKEALSKLSVDPDETAFVGDTIDADVKGPKEVGMKTVYIDRRPQKELEFVCPDQIIKSLGDLPDAIEKC